MFKCDYWNNFLLGQLNLIVLDYCIHNVYSEAKGYKKYLKIIGDSVTKMYQDKGYMAKKMLQEEGIFVPIVTTLHGTDITLVGKDPSFEPVITFAINQSDGVTAVSQSLKDDTFEHFNINREIEVIPNFVNLDTIEHKWEEKHGLKKMYAIESKLAELFSCFLH